MKESYLYKKLAEKKVQCRTCAHYCIIQPGQRGKCGVRENKGGKLEALNYAKACALQIDPVEKKPLYHFMPGSLTLSLATVGCNFRCSNCQNWLISQAPRLHQGEVQGEKISPSEIVERAVKEKTPSISYTYTEPTIFLEYGLDTMKLAREKGIKNIWVTNGFLSEETLKLISPWLDAANVDLKSYNKEFYKEHCGARLQPVLRTLKEMKRSGVHLEVTTLVIPTLTDDLAMLEQIARFIKEELGAETPWHVSRFSASISWRLRDLPDTSVKKIVKTCENGQKMGLKYVYAGNTLGLDLQTTFCPNCRTKIVERAKYPITCYDQSGACPQCGQEIGIIRS